MASYYVNMNKDDKGDNEVHISGCNWMPAVSNKEYLGEFYNCNGAVSEAKRRGYNANGCYRCSRSCHTS